MKQIQSPEFKDALKKMQQALENLDRRALEQQMPDWRAQNQELLNNLERTLELLKKLREEEKVQELAKRAQDLKAQQDALNQEHRNAANRPDASKSEKDEKGESLSERQKRAAEESRQLAKQTQEQADQANDAQQKQQMDTAAQEMSKEAAPSQDQAAQSSQSGQNEQAQKSGEKASDALEKAAARMKSTAEQMQSDQNQLDLASVRRAAQDLVSLQR
ncbi:MAG: hypothetical protein E6K80_07145 [Candidatus Eisenbacteria bacterium]|uniref:DUF4175 domain-containing protein n=1 Tax=Eiseniibacteriota bacterium TaxID=2212470 RepID=A0A538U4S5_UNCEI|nr:MAG: hypothetical protein E6K80_07145 [Candidatus Eisenbacteria bacterium]